MRLALLTILLTLTLSACAQTKRNPVTQNTPSLESTIDREAARKLSDKIVDALIKDDREDLFSKMEPQAREYFGMKGLNNVLDTMFKSYGKPLSAEFKKDEIGSQIYHAGESRPFRKFWYVVETTTFSKDSHFIFVEIVANNQTLASSGVAIVNFPMGVPPDMK